MGTLTLRKGLTSSKYKALTPGSVPAVDQDKKLQVADPESKMSNKRRKAKEWIDLLEDLGKKYPAFKIDTENKSMRYAWAGSFVKKQLAEAENLSKKKMGRLVGVFHRINEARYLRAVIDRRPRVDLYGKVIREVSDSDVENAKALLENHKVKMTKVKKKRSAAKENEKNRLKKIRNKK